jgi:hypothetical protein
MKKLILPVAVALLAGIGGGTGVAFMSMTRAGTEDSVKADSAHAKNAKDSTAHAVDDSSQAANDVAVAKDSLIADSALHALPLTPADSIRAVEKARAEFRAVPPTHGAAVSSTPAARPAVAGAAIPAAKPAALVVKPVTATGTSQVAEAVRSARNDAQQTALPEQRLAKIFGAMQSKDAARVLEQMTDSDVRTILGMMSDRQAAAILAAFPAPRAAAITKGAVHAPGSTP